MAKSIKVPVTQQYIYDVQGKPIIMIPITTLIRILNDLFISNLNTCQSKSVIQKLFFDKNLEIKSCDYIKFLCHKFPISEEFFENFARLLYQELPMDLAKKISPQKNQTLNINFIGKGDYDGVDTSEENQLTDPYKNLIGSEKFSFNFSTYPILILPANERETKSKSLPTLIDNGSTHGTRHTLYSEKMLLINAQKFFSQKNEKMWDIKDFYPLIDSLKNKEYFIPIDKDGNITILNKSNEDYELNECGQKILDFFYEVSGVSKDFIKNFIEELAKKLLNENDYNINKIKPKNDKTKEQIINDSKIKYLEDMLIEKFICEVNNNSENKKTLNMKDFYPLKFDLREYDIPIDNDGNITILYKNNDDYELNECGQKILKFFHEISNVSEISIKGFLLKLAKEMLLKNESDYNINKIDKEIYTINDSKIMYIEDMIVIGFVHKINDMKLDLPTEIYDSILSKQPDILDDNVQIDNNLFGPIHLIQCIFYTCMLYCLDKDDEIKKTVITKIIKIRDDFQTIEKFEESEYAISKINLSAGIDMVSCMLHLIFNDCPNFSHKEIENIKNIVMYLYGYFFPSNVEHVTQYNFLKLNNENRTYNDGILIPETGEFCFPLPILYEKITGNQFPIHIDMADGNQKVSELKLYEFQIPITDVDADTINCLEIEVIVKNSKALKENLQYLDNKKFSLCLEHIMSLNCSLTEKQEMFSIFFPYRKIINNDSEIKKLSFDQILKYYPYIDINCFNGIKVQLLKKWNEYIINSNNLQEDFVKKFFYALAWETDYFTDFFHYDLLSNFVKYQDLINFESFFGYPSLSSERFFFNNKDYEEIFLKYLNQNKSDSNVCRLIANKFFATKYFEKYSDDSEVWNVYKNCDPELFANCNGDIFDGFLVYLNDNIENLNEDEKTEVLKRLKIKINKFPESINDFYIEQISMFNEAVTKESLLLLYENKFKDLINILLNQKLVSHEFLQKIFYALLEKNEFYNAVEPNQILKLIQYCDCQKSDKLSFLVSYANKLNIDNEKIFYEPLVENISEFYVPDILERLSKIKNYLQDEQVNELQKKYNEEDTKTIKIEQSEISVDNVDNLNSKSNELLNENVKKDSEDNSEINFQIKNTSTNDLNSLQKETLEENLSKNNRWLDKALKILGFVFILASPFGFFASLTLGLSLLISLVLFGSTSIVLGFYLNKRYKENSTPKNLENDFDLGNTQVDSNIKNVIATEPNPKKYKDTTNLSNILS